MTLPRCEPCVTPKSITAQSCHLYTHGFYKVLLVHWRGILLLYLLCFLASTARAQPFVPSQASWADTQHLVISYDPLRLPKKEAMGLLGTAYLLPVAPNAYLGLGVYSAVAGRRGGFFTGGFEGALQGQIVDAWGWRAGYFIGGGGGGAAPQGGGLMVRPHIGFTYQTGWGYYGAAWSQVWFPNGQINSTTLTGSITWPIHELWRTGWLAASRSENPMTKRNDNDVEVSRQVRQLSMQHQWYFTPQQNYRRQQSTAAPVELLGVRWRMQRQSLWLLDLQALGAWGGDADGYAEINAGIGVHQSLGRQSEAYALLSIGAGGGGGIDTAGGLVSRFAVGGSVVVPYSRALSVYAEVGYLQSLEMRFSAYTVALGLAYTYAVPREIAYTADWQKLRVRPVLQHFVVRMQSQPMNVRDMDLIALKMDWMLSSHGYLTGSSVAAYDGGAGGFAMGMFGVGLCAYCSNAGNIAIELNVGAAGGGGVNVGRGVVVQPMINAHYMVNRQWEAIVGAGGIMQPNGHIQAGVLELGVGLRFSAPRLAIPFN